MENETIERYYFSLNDYDAQGRHKITGTTFRQFVDECERHFHSAHSTSYAVFFYANQHTMTLLQHSCDANPMFSYGMELYNGNEFDPVEDPNANANIDHYSSRIMVYGIDSAYMEDNKDGIKVMNENKGIFPLTLLIDNTMEDNTIKLSCPNTNNGDSDEIEVPVAPNHKLITV